MKVLISAFACEPGKGSEPGVGWNIASQLAKHHDVTVITSIEHRDHTLRYMREHGLTELPFRIHYHGSALLNRIMVRIPHHLGYNLYALCWYRTVGKVMRKLNREHHFDLAHHLTWATFKYYDPICELGIPYVIGPVGGGEMAPKGFDEYYSPLNSLMERIRALHFRRMCGNRRIRNMLDGASRIVATTPETASAIRRITSTNCMVMQAIGVDEHQIASASETGGGAARSRNLTASDTVNVLFLGEMKYWKGIDVLIRTAFHLARVFTGTDFHFNIVGGGHDIQEFRNKVKALSLETMFTFYGRVNHDTALAMYADNDIFFYPSYHDSGALVVYEAMANRLPVLVLNTGGPGYNVHNGIGFKVNPERSIDTTARHCADTLRHMAGMILDGTMSSVEDAAIKYLQDECLWSQRADALSHIYRQSITGDDHARSADD